MPTVSEVLRSVSRDFVVLAGAAGLGREVRRILFMRAPSELTAAIGRDDLVYAMSGAHGDSTEAADRAVTALLSAGVAGVLSDVVPSVTAIQAADGRGSPLVASSPGVEAEQLCAMLTRALEQHQAALDLSQAKLHVDFVRLSRAGATPAMLLERLVETTGKTGLVQATETGCEEFKQPALLGAVSLGHAVRSRAEGKDAHSALVQAAEAALLGEELFGPGQVTSYADAQLARFLLDNHHPRELSALYERAVGKLAVEDNKRERELVATLEVYCETFATRGTADRLGVHRNTVLYRLKLIEEITSVDLDDGASRLPLQLGVLAGRLARRTSRSRLHGAVQLGTPHLVKVGQRPRVSQARTA